MSNKNENNFYIISGPLGLLRLDIMVCKAKVLTYIWSFSKNLRKIWKTDFMMKRLHFGSANKNENNFCIVSSPGESVELWYYGSQG